MSSIQPIQRTKPLQLMPGPESGQPGTDAPVAIPPSTPQYGTSTPAPTVPAGPRRGRPRKHPNDAARKRAHQEKKKVEKAADKILKKALSILQEHHDRKGEIHSEISGGNDATKISTIQTNSGFICSHTGEPTRSKYQKSTKPSGHGPDKEEPDPWTPREKQTKETDSTFMRRIRFPRRREISQYRKERIVEELTRQFLQSIPHSLEFYCECCGEILDWFRDGIRHVAEVHHEDVQSRIKEETPKCWAVKKSKRCPGSYHLEMRDRLARNPESDGRYYCKICETLLYDSAEREFRRHFSEAVSAK
jgi:hypothetical protein